MKRKLILFAAVLSLLCACGNSSSTAKTSQAVDNGTVAEYAAVNNYSAADASGSTATDNRKIITTGSMSLETKDLDTAVSGLQALITQYQGSIQSSSTNGDGYTQDSGSYARSAMYEVRVPAESFQQFADACKQLGNVVSTSTSTQDVTDDYTDNDAHLESLQAEQTKLQELLGEATNVSDVLAIQQQLSDVEYQIQSYTSIKKNYDSQIAQSTLSISISEVQSYTSTHPDFWKTFAESFGSSFHGFISFLQNVLIFLVYLIPYALILAAVILIVRWRRRVKDKKNQLKL
jgi:hypothetical protein